MTEAHPYLDPTAYLERKVAAFDAAVNAILRKEVNWLHNEPWSAGIVGENGKAPVCVILRYRDPATGEDESNCYLPGAMWGQDNPHSKELDQLVADVTEIVAGASEGAPDE